MTNNKIPDDHHPVETVYILNSDSKRDTPKFNFPELIDHIKHNPFKYSTFDLFSLSPQTDSFRKSIMVSENNIIQFSGSDDSISNR